MDFVDTCFIVLIAIFMSQPVDSNVDTVACGTEQPRLLSNYTGRFVSENFPQNYSNNLGCSWLMRSQVSGGTVMLDFPTIRIEGGYADYLVVYDSNTETNETANFTGNYDTSPSTIFSSGTDLLVVFYTDPSGNDMGFEAIFTSDTACSQKRELPLPTGWFSSPYYPETYTRNKTCEWSLTLAENEVADIQFESFIVGVGIPPSSCTTDYLELITYNGTARFCGNMTPPTTIPVQYSITFRFASHPINTPATGNGFLVYYETRNASDAAVEVTTESVNDLTTQYSETRSATTDGYGNSNSTDGNANSNTTDGYNNSNSTDGNADSNTTDGYNNSNSSDGNTDSNTTDDYSNNTDDNTFSNITGPPSTEDSGGDSEFPIWAIVVISVVSALVIVGGIVGFTILYKYGHHNKVNDSRRPLNEANNSALGGQSSTANAAKDSTNTGTQAAVSDMASADGQQELTTVHVVTTALAD